MPPKKIALMTCGGDAPGLNSFITACAKTLATQKTEVLGVRNGFEGFLKKEIFPLKDDHLSHYAQAGTVLGTSSRLDLHDHKSEFIKVFNELQLDGLIVSGGDGTFSSLEAVMGEVPVIGVSKTIDNDLQNSDQTIGFDTAVTAVTETIDILRATADSHHRSFIIETMGRHTGWIALRSGLTAFADGILIPEIPFDRTQLKNFIQQKNKKSFFIVMAEGAAAVGENQSIAFSDPKSKEKEKFGGAALSLARWLESETQIEFRHQVVGYLQRGHAPTNFDRLLAIELGIKAADLAIAGTWNHAVTWHQGTIETRTIKTFMGPPRKIHLDHPWLKEASTLGIFV